MSSAAPGLTALLWAALATLSCALTGSAPCPGALDCARLGRRFCRPGTSSCGSCLQPLVQNSRGRCVPRRRPHHLSPRPPGHATPTGSFSFPELDEQIDIDLLTAIVTQQRSQVTLPGTANQSAGITGTANQSAGITGTANQSAGITGTANQSAGITAPPPLKDPAPSAPPANRSASPSAPPTAVTNHSSALLSAVVQPRPRPPSDSDVFIVMSSVFIVTGSVALMIAGACWVRLQRGVHVSQVDFHPYGLKKTQTYNQPGDRRLVQNAQMFHYQHQRQQILSIQTHGESPKEPDSGASSDDDNDDGDFTVYECPGLAPTGEMEVKNPLFDDSTLYFHRFHK